MSLATRFRCRSFHSLTDFKRHRCRRRGHRNIGRMRMIRRHGMSFGNGERVYERQRSWDTRVRDPCRIPKAEPLAESRDRVSGGSRAEPLQKQDRSERSSERSVKELVLLAKNGEQEAGSDSRADNACDVGSHCVHKKEVRRIRLLSLHLRYTGSHRNCGNAC